MTQLLVRQLELEEEVRRLTQLNELYREDYATVKAQLEAALDRERAQAAGRSSPAVTHRDLCRKTALWVAAQTWSDVVAVEVDGWDVAAVSDPWAKRVKPRAVICEVKRTRSDLLADLRARKCLTRYPPRATHLYLVASSEALGVRKGEPWSEWKPRVLAELTELGVPTTWGIMCFGRVDGKAWDKIGQPYSLRACRGGGTLELTPDRHRARFAKLARSVSYRAISAYSPTPLGLEPEGHEHD